MTNKFRNFDLKAFSCKIILSSNRSVQIFSYLLSWLNLSIRLSEKKCLITSASGALCVFEIMLFLRIVCLKPITLYWYSFGVLQGCPVIFELTVYQFIVVECKSSKGRYFRGGGRLLSGVNRKVKN